VGDPYPTPQGVEKRRQYAFVFQTLNELSLEWPKSEPDAEGNWLPAVTIISGAARGADRAGTDWAIVNWCPILEYPAQWDRYGKRAGYLRNKQMLEEGRPNLVVAFPGGKGTAMMVKIAKEAGIETRTIFDPHLRDNRETVQ
jgi:hypothetical protein